MYSMARIVLFLYCIYYFVFIYVFPYILGPIKEEFFSVSISQPADCSLILLMFINSLLFFLIFIRFLSFRLAFWGLIGAFVAVALSCSVTEYSVRRAGILQFRPSVQAIWELNPHCKLYNKYGMNYRELNADPESGEFRIMLLGDSTAYGFGCDRTVSDARLGKCFSDILEKKLKDKFLRDINVLNAAVPGYSSLQMARTAERLKFLKPDFFIISTNSDWTSEPRSDISVIESQRLVFIKNFLYKLDFYLYLRSCLQAFSTDLLKPRDRVVPRVSAADTYKYLSAIMAMSEINIPAIIMDMPLNLPQVPEEGDIAYELSDLENYRRAIRKVAEDNRAVLLSIDKDWNERFGNEKSRLFIDSVHPDNKGHEILADSLFDAIVENGIIPNN